MKKLGLKIVILMLLVMGCVVGLSQLILLIIRTQNVDINPNISYAVSLVSGFVGLIIFLLLMEYFVFRRIKKLTKAVKQVQAGDYSIDIKAKNFDEIDKLLKDFNHMVKQLQANEYLSQEFVKNVSHEFKTPLSSIIGYSNLLQQTPQNLTDEQIQYLQIINQQAKHLENMSRHMLLISQLDANTNPMPDIEFSISEQIRSIILGAQTQWLDKHLEWDLDLCETPVINQADLCYCIWQNLISNAIKFAPTNSHIEISLKITDTITFNISNHGPMIDKTEQTMLFKQFYRNKNHVNPHGSGLGLALINKILNKLNGDITVTSDIQATTFSVTIPNQKQTSKPI